MFSSHRAPGRRMAVFTLCVVALALAGALNAAFTTADFVANPKPLGMTPLGTGSTDLWANAAVDDSFITAPIGFDFEFYGTNYNTVNVCSNGYILLGGTASITYTGQVYPSTAIPNGCISLCQEDLYKNSTDTLKYQTTGSAPARKFIIEFNFTFYYNTGRVIGQIHLNEGKNTIEFHFADSQQNWSGNSSGMGCENPAGTQGINCSPTNTLWTTHPTTNFIIEPPEITWTGAVSSDWNTPSNWASNSVPTADDNVGFPQLNAGAFNATIPTQATVVNVRIENGATLNGGSGRLNLKGNWTNEGGGIFAAGTSVVEYMGDGPQAINCGGGSIGNVIIRNSVEPVVVKDILFDTNTGVITVQPGAQLQFTNHCDFQKIGGITNNGLISFEATALQQILSKPAVNFGKVFARASTSTDTLEFYNDIAFGNDSVFTGGGRINFANNVTSPSTAKHTFSIDFIYSLGTIQAGDMSFRNNVGGIVDGISGGSIVIETPVDFTVNQNVIAAGSVEFLGNGTTTIYGDLNAANNIFNNDGPVNITGDVTASTHNFFNGAGLITVISGDIVAGGDNNFGALSTVTSLNATAIATGRNWVVSDFPIELSGFGGTQTDLRGSGSVRLNGATNVDIMYIEPTGNVDCLGSVTCDILVVNSPVQVKIDGTVTVIDDLTISSSGPVALNADLRIAGDMTDTATGQVQVAGRIIAFGTGSSQTISVDNHALRALQFHVTGLSLVKVEGELNLTQNGPNPQAVLVEEGAGVELMPGSKLLVGAGASFGQVHIDGVLVTTNSGTPSAADRAVIGANSGAARAFVNFGPTSALAVSGLVFQNVGHQSQSYAVVIEDGALVNAFGDVAFRGVDSTTAVLQLSTDQVPQQLSHFEFEGSFGGSLRNVDASLISLSQRVLITEAPTGGGSLYGTSLEIDPSDSIVWENPPAIAIQSDSRLPNAQVGMPYIASIQATGGNRPFEYIITQKPSWLVLDALSGVLSGVPELKDIGTFQFPITILDATVPGLSTSKVFTLQVETIAQVDLTFLNSDISRAKEGEIFSQNLVAGGGVAPYTFTRVGSQPLPAGLSISPGGAIFGVPISGSRGTYTVRLRVTDSSTPTQLVEREFTMAVQSDLADPEFLALASEDPGSSCSVRGQQGSWSWLFFGLAAGAAVAVRRRVRNRA